MMDFINKESWYKNGLYSKKFHYKYVTLKRYLKCGDRNSDLIDDDIDDLSDVDKNLSGLRYPPDLNRERFI
jgi:hypothetical protein